MKQSTLWLMLAGAGLGFCPAIAQAASFEELMGYVYEHNPALIAQREAVKAADEAVAEAVSGYRPSVSAEYDKGRQRARYNQQDRNYNDASTKELRVVQPIFNGGETVAQVASAKARVKAARAQLQTVEQQVFLDAVTAQAGLVEAREILAISISNLQVLREQQEAVSSRFKDQQVTRTDLAQAQSRMAKAEADLAQADADMASAEALFARNIGLPPEAVDMPPLPGGLPATWQEVKSLALANPMLTEAHFREKAASRDIDTRYSALSPSVSLQASTRDNEGGTVPGVHRYREDIVTLNVSIPLYQSGSEYARIREAKNLYQKARYDTMDASRTVTEAALRSWNGYVASQKVIASGEKAVSAAKDALGGVQEENKAGARTVLDVLDAEQEYFAANVSLQKAHRLERVAAYQLLAALGRLNVAVLKLKVPVYDPVEHYEDVRYLPAGW